LGFGCCLYTPFFLYRDFKKNQSSQKSWLAMGRLHLPASAGGICYRNIVGDFFNYNFHAVNHACMA
jgi:hypothetical protein